MKYELFYLVGASKEAELEKIKTGASEIVAADGGVFEEKQVTEKRKLGYAVKHEAYGFYVAQRFELDDPEKIKSINRKLNLNTGILRFIISKVSDLPELKSREERMAESEKITRPMKKEEVISQPTKPRMEEKVEKRLKKKTSEEDIDKKLEEILNI